MVETAGRAIGPMTFRYNIMTDGVIWHCAECCNYGTLAILDDAENVSAEHLSTHIPYKHKLIFRALADPHYDGYRHSLEYTATANFEWKTISVTVGRKWL